MGNVHVWFIWTGSLLSKSASVQWTGVMLLVVVELHIVKKKKKRQKNCVQPAKCPFYILHNTHHILTIMWCVVISAPTCFILFWWLFLDCADTSTVPLRLVFIPCINKDYCLQTLATLPLLLRRAHSPCISYHFESGCLKTSRPCGSRVHCGSRRKEWFRGPQPRHFPPEQPLTRGAINH